MPCSDQRMAGEGTGLMEILRGAPLNGQAPPHPLHVVMVHTISNHISLYLETSEEPGAGRQVGILSRPSRWLPLQASG